MEVRVQGSSFTVYRVLGFRAVRVYGVLGFWVEGFVLPKGPKYCYGEYFPKS